MIEIDGSMGEGGGQVLRTSLALAAITGEGVRLTNIRAGRGRPGLLRQHLACVRAAVAISGGDVEGDALGSREITFVPGPVRAGDYAFAIGSAGSASLVLQAVLPPLLLADAPSTVRVEGGTHNSGAPPFHFLDRVFRPAVPGLALELAKWGFYPAGGGVLVARVAPGGLAPVDRVARGEVRAVHGHAAISGIAHKLGHRALGAFKAALGLDRDHLHFHQVPEPVGPGFACWIEVELDGGVEHFTAFGEKRVEPEALAHEALAAFEAWRALDVPVGEHLADQLLLPMALAGGRMRTGPLSLHARTNMAVIERFLGPTFTVEGDEVRATPRSAGSCAP